MIGTSRAAASRPESDSGLRAVAAITLKLIRILILALVCAKTEEVLASQRARGGAGTTDVTDTARTCKPGRGRRTQYPKRDHQQ